MAGTLPVPYNELLLLLILFLGANQNIPANLVKLRYNGVPHTQKSITPVLQATIAASHTARLLQLCLHQDHQHSQHDLPHQWIPTHLPDRTESQTIRVAYPLPWPRMLPPSGRHVILSNCLPRPHRPPLHRGNRQIHPSHSLRHPRCPFASTFACAVGFTAFTNSDLSEWGWVTYQTTFDHALNVTGKLTYFHQHPSPIERSA